MFRDAAQRLLLSSFTLHGDVQPADTFWSSPTRLHMTLERAHSEDNNQRQSLQQILSKLVNVRQCVVKFCFSPPPTFVFDFLERQPLRELNIDPSDELSPASVLRLLTVAPVVSFTDLFMDREDPGPSLEYITPRVEELIIGYVSVKLYELLAHPQLKLASTLRRLSILETCYAWRAVHGPEFISITAPTLEYLYLGNVVIAAHPRHAGFDGGSPFDQDARAGTSCRGGDSLIHNEYTAGMPKTYDQGRCAREVTMTMIHGGNHPASLVNGLSSRAVSEVQPSHPCGRLVEGAEPMRSPCRHDRPLYRISHRGCGWSTASPSSYAPTPRLRDVSRGPDTRPIPSALGLRFSPFGPLGFRTYFPLDPSVELQDQLKGIDEAYQADHFKREQLHGFRTQALSLLLPKTAQQIRETSADAGHTEAVAETSRTKRIST
ncbi:hypothetical protein C8R45DRAFT_1081961 [Mycena sanguinolenta]|nr:hypothetical protein C8R45DRAFT_1081961 [Mycena sanguinolenta]